MVEFFQEKLREKDREAHKRKEREERELEEVRSKVRRKDASSAYKALLTEKIKDPEVNSCCLLFRFSSVLDINTSASYHQTLSL